MYRLIKVEIPDGTLSRLIDFAHAAMQKRPDHPDDYPLSRSRIGPDGHAVIYAKDWRTVQALGPPSWQAVQKDKGSTRKRLVVEMFDSKRLCWVELVGEGPLTSRDGLLECPTCRVIWVEKPEYGLGKEEQPFAILTRESWVRGVPV